MARHPPTERSCARPAPDLVRLAATKFEGVGVIGNSLHFGITRGFGFGIPVYGPSFTASRAHPFHADYFYLLLPAFAQREAALMKANQRQVFRWCLR